MMIQHLLEHRMTLDILSIRGRQAKAQVIENDDGTVSDIFVNNKMSLRVLWRYFINLDGIEIKHSTPSAKKPRQQRVHRINEQVGVALEEVFDRIPPVYVKWALDGKTNKGAIDFSSDDLSQFSVDVDKHCRAIRDILLQAGADTIETDPVSGVSHPMSPGWSQKGTDWVPKFLEDTIMARLVRLRDDSQAAIKEHKELHNSFLMSEVSPRCKAAQTIYTNSICGVTVSRIPMSDVRNASWLSDTAMERGGISYPGGRRKEVDRVLEGRASLVLLKVDAEGEGTTILATLPNQDEADAVDVTELGFRAARMMVGHDLLG